MPSRPADNAAVRRLAAELAKVDRRLFAVESSPQLANSSLPVDDVEVSVPDLVTEARDAAAAAADLGEDLEQARAELEQARVDLDEAQSALAQKLDTAEGDLAAAEVRLADAEQRVSDAITVAGQADAAAQAAGAAAAAAQTAADTATSEAVAAQSAADTAAQAAADAAGIAAGKGKVVFSTAAPAEVDQLATTLWIDTTGGANTPKRWSGTAWVAVTDKAAVDAASAAASAQSDATAAIGAAAAAQLRADQAHTLAGTAESNAQAAIVAASGAQATANGRPLMLFSTAVAQGTAPQGSVWFRVNATGQVIGQWQQTAPGAAGSTWAVREIRSEVIANLDVGKLTAGTAVVVDVVAQKIAAATAAFQTVDVKNLFVTGTSTVATQVAQAIWAAKIVAGKILASEVLIGGPGANLLPDAMVTTQAAYTRSAGVVQNPTGGRSGAGAFVVTSTATAQDWTTAATLVDAARPYLVPAQGGRQYVVEAAVRPSVAVDAASTSVQLLRYFYDAAGTLLGSGVLNFDVALPAGAWTTVRATTPVAPENTAYVRVGGRVGAAMAAGAVVEWSDPACYLAVDSALVVDGTVTAAKLAAVLVLGSRIIAGNPAGTHAEMSPTGLRVYAPPADGEAEPREVIRLGTDTDDYFGIIGTDGELAASIDTVGEASFTGLATVDDPVFAGRPMLGDFAGFDQAYQSQLDTANLGWLDRLPRGLVASGYGVPSDDTISTRYGIAEVQFLDYPGRSYRVTMSGLHVYGTAGAKVLVSLRFTRDGTAPTINSPLLGTSMVHLPATGQAYTTPPIIVTGTFRAAGAAEATPIRVLACIERQAGTGNIGYNTYNGDAQVFNPFRLVVEDVGLDIPDLYLPSAGGGSKTAQQPTPPPTNPKVTRTTEWAGAWSQNYTLAGAQTTAMAGKAVQGGSYPARKCLVGFPSVTATLSGATVNWVEVYIYFAHWYYNAGGTAVIGAHGHTSAPGSYSATDGLVTSANWPKPGGRWVRLPSSTHAGFKSGATRGISLRAPGDTTNLQYYGYATSTRLRINYTK
ncbi:hypothetical protein [Cellulosimicrobium cellulans]|uniref:hypothetical protein n=1 Tax=Cellulosimicrobium cellulans TaxID=1710 RepID=UPI001BA525D4|nr:hypothetical protein [Cellulosimicrobium cellulans]QUC01229.1 hypothetical protein J5A69_08730 [Cellulosimicrobium cellulans]